MILSVAGLMLQAQSSSSDAPAAPSPSCGVEFVHTPIGAEVADYYPEAAFPQRLAGDTSIDCVIAGDLKLAQCIVTGETPMGYGFGDATIKYLTINARGNPADAAGQSCIGQHVKVSFHWDFTRSIDQFPATEKKPAGVAGGL
jgi:hypothetical protein